MRPSALCQRVPPGWGVRFDRMRSGTPSTTPLAGSGFTANRAAARAAARAQASAEGLPAPVEPDEPDRAARCARPGVRRRLGGEDEEVDAVDEQRPLLVEPGEHEEVVHERRHPYGLALDACHDLAQPLRPGHRALPVQLGVALDGRQGGAQLVAGVGDELPHPRLGRLLEGEAALDLTEHRVERARELSDLGLGVVTLHALGEVPLRDPGGIAPVRAYLPELTELVTSGAVDPSPVFDLELPLDDVAEAYRAMDERRAIKALLRP
mgnify:CR=1 FL=1